MNISKDKKQVFLFSAPWCKPCQRVKTYYDDIVKSNPDYEFNYINIDENGDLMDEVGVTKIPTWVVYKNGEKTHTLQHSDRATVEKELFLK